MTLYNSTLIENNTNLLEIFTVTNTMSGNMLVILLVLSVFLITFIGLKNYDTLTALRTASFLTSILSVLFWTIDLLAMWIMMLPIIILGITVLLGFLIEK